HSPTCWATSATDCRTPPRRYRSGPRRPPAGFRPSRWQSINNVRQSAVKIFALCVCPLMPGLRAKKGGGTYEDDFDDGFRSRVQSDHGAVLFRSGPVVLPDGAQHGPHRRCDLISGFGLAERAARVRSVGSRNRRDSALPSSPRALFAALTLAAFAAFGTFSLPHSALADSALAALVAKPVSLPDMALGPANAPVNIVEYSSLTCPHCADFAENVFPMLKSKYIDTGKVHFVSREFPLEIKAAGASMLARCAANGDAPQYFDAIGMLFKQQQALVEHTTETLKAV